MNMLHLLHPETYEQTIRVLRQSTQTAPGDWDLCLTAFGVFRSRGGFANAVVSPVHNVHVIRRGRGTVLAGDREYTVAGGDVFVFWPGEKIRYHDHPGRPWRYDWFLLEGRQVEWALAQAGLTRETPHCHCPRLRRSLDRLATAIKAETDAGFAPIREAWLFFDALARLRGWPGRIGAARSETKPSAAGLAETCRQLIDGKYMNDLSVDQLARQFGVDRTTLFRQFRRRFACSPKEYLDRVRLNQARELLADPNQQVKQVAYACGFASPYYFSQAFRRRFGLSPENWRRQELPGGA